MNPGVTINGNAVDKSSFHEGYAKLHRTWKDGDVIALDFPMPVLRYEAHPNVKADAGMVAMQRGPIVYGLEGLDNNNNARITLPVDPQFETEYRPDFLHGTMVIKGRDAAGNAFLAIPYHLWQNRDNRKITNCEVWLKQADKIYKPAGWDNKLYRIYA